MILRIILNVSLNTLPGRRWYSHPGPGHGQKRGVQMIAVPRRSHTGVHKLHSQAWLRIAACFCSFSFLLLNSPLSLAKEEQKPDTTRQYTFAWQFLEGSEMAPRGGTTRGADVQLVKGATAEWKALQEENISLFERDRRAILAMAGEYRASFDFIEVAGFTENYKPSQPYQSWGTEKVYVIEDRGDFISLQHILQMSFVDEDGKVSGPFVTKHWRQDWQFEPESVLVFQGLNTWSLQPVAADFRRGAWGQTVYHVDDSPRYAAVAQWEHTRNYSSWKSSETWRPLPRREFSVRKDYDVLIGTNAHTILPSGWIHEQQNNKAVLNNDGDLRAKRAILSREYGLNRYERIQGTDFTAADAYLERTKVLWQYVRQEWNRAALLNNPLVLKGATDQEGLYTGVFKLADEMSPDSGRHPREVHADARRAVEAYLQTDGEREAAKKRYFVPRKNAQ